MSELSATPAPVSYNKLQLIIILLTPLLIMAGSTALYFSGWLMPDEKSNNGWLLTPVLSVTDLGLPEVVISDERQWQLIQYSPKCEQSCSERLYQQRQMHVALGKYQTRIQRSLISAAPLPIALQPDYPKLTVIEQPSAQLSAEALARIPPEHLQDDLVFVVDPFGNIMLYFTSEQDYKAQMSDLKKLLKLSTIG